MESTIQTIIYNTQINKYNQQKVFMCGTRLQILTFFKNAAISGKDKYISIINILEQLTDKSVQVITQIDQTAYQI